MNHRIIKRSISVILALTMIFFSFAVCYADNQNNKNNDQKEYPMDPSVMKPWVNSNLLGMVTWDTTENYKDDFYYAVNHDWLRDAHLEPGESSEATFNDASETIDERCMEILDDSNLSGDDAELIRNYYELWLDWDGRNKLGITPIQSWVEALEKTKTIDDFTKFLLSEEYEQYGLFPVSIDMAAYPEDSSLYMAYINTPSLYLGDAAEYKELTENGQRIKKLRDSMASYMLGRLGKSDDEIQTLLESVNNIDSKLAGHEKSVLEQHDPSYLKESINYMTMDDIRTLSPNFPLADYMEKEGWAKAEHINIEWPDSISALNELYTDDNLEDLKAKILVTNVIAYMSQLDEDAFRTYEKLVEEASGITDAEPDETDAYQETRSLFPDSFARIYVERYLNEGIKAEITKLCQDVVDTYREMLDSVDWLTDQTKAAAKEKLDKLQINAVYPDKWEDYSIFHVTSKKDGGTYFQAYLDYCQAANKRNIERINDKKDPDIWGIDILVTNAYYDPTGNSINIIPGFFCDYTYSEEMSIEEKYGAIGTVIGHEISHAFDTNGSQYDADGNVKDWWTDEDKQAFAERTKKLVDFYDQVVAFDDGTPYYGQLVQTEAIADMAGVKCILKMAEKIDGFDYDRFFKTHEKMWARVETVEAAEANVAVDPHPLHYLRGNVNVQQYDEFYKTYNIKEGDGMYVAPEDRIAVW